MRRYLTLLAVAACGDDGAVVDAGIATDAAVDAPVAYYGSILILEHRDNGMNSTLIGAGFATLQQTVTSTRTEGPCTISKRMTSSGPPVSAGMLTVAGGTVGDLVLQPDAESRYVLSSVGYRYADNDALTITGSGAVVPAFTASVSFPPALTVTSPTNPSAVSKSAGVMVTWTPTTGTVRIGFNQYAATPDTFVSCEYDASLGTARIPGTVFAELTTGLSTSFAIVSENESTVNAGPYEILVNASYSGFSKTVNVVP